MGKSNIWIVPTVTDGPVRRRTLSQVQDGPIRCVQIKYRPSIKIQHDRDFELSQTLSEECNLIHVFWNFWQRALGISIKVGPDANVARRAIDIQGEANSIEAISL